MFTCNTVTIVNLKGSASLYRYKVVMKTIVLISCVSKKLPRIAKAKDLYISPLFRLSLEYAKCLNADGIYILSAKYGLLPLDEEIAPYEQTLNRMSGRERKQWAQGMLAQLRAVADLRSDRFIILAGEKYREHLVPKIEKYDVPLEKLRIGEQLRRLKNLIGQKTTRRSATGGEKATSYDQW